MAACAIEVLRAEPLVGAFAYTDLGGALPDCVGPYRLVRQVGAGGMGIVYEARQASPNRRVALKLVRSLRGKAIQATFPFTLPPPQTLHPRQAVPSPLLLAPTDGLRKARAYGQDVTSSPAEKLKPAGPPSGSRYQNWKFQVENGVPIPQLPPVTTTRSPWMFQPMGATRPASRRTRGA